MLNHKKDFNPNYTVEHHSHQLDGNYPMKQHEFTELEAQRTIESINKTERLTKLFFINDHSAKIFLRGGSSMVVDLTNGDTLYEELRTRPIVYKMNRLHLNPNRAWTIFSDLFVVSLLIITITGLFMVKGRRGLWGVGGIELLLGIIIPIILLFL